MKDTKLYTQHSEEFIFSDVKGHSQSEVQKQTEEYLLIFPALPKQSLLDRNPAELTAIFYSLNLEGQDPAFISPKNRMAQLCPRALCSLMSPLTTRRTTVEVS
jgi:hypothetical protein